MTRYYFQITFSISDTVVFMLSAVDWYSIVQYYLDGNGDRCAAVQFVLVASDVGILGDTVAGR